MLTGRHYTLAAVAVALGFGHVGLGADGILPGWSRKNAEIARSDGKSAIRIAGDEAVPVLRQVDVLMIGSSLDGCFLAERAARRGQAVVLASTGTSLPREIAIGLRPWINADDLSKAPEDIKAFVDSCMKQKAGGEIILDMIQVTEGLENRILDAGVGLYYDVHPCGVQMQGRRIAAVLFGCKGGLVAIEAKTIVDCTPDARVAKLAGADVATRKSQSVVVRYSMLCANPPGQRVLTVEGVPELVDAQVLMHGDYAEFRVRLPAARGVFRESVYDLETRRVAAEAAAVLRDTLKKTTFVRGGDVVLADPIERIVSRSTDKKLSLDACRPKSIDNLLVCSPAVDVDDAVARTLVEPLTGPSLAGVIEKVPWQQWSKARADGKKRVRFAADLTSGKTATAEARFMELRPVYSTGASIPIGAVRLPVIADCDVLVVGAGTSGMPAAVAAARQGAKTIVVEKYGDVGGTHTIGGVSKYWYGRNTDFVQRLDADAFAMMKKTGMPKCMGMLHSLMKADARLVTHCLAVGAVVEGRTVVGAVVVTPRGLGAIKAKRIVDATGDGDIAARAGAETDYGTRRDAMTLWYSFAQYAGTNPEARRHFAYVADPRDPADMTRAIIAGRRFKRGKVTAPQYYLTPRESRHIRGGHTVTVVDILAGRRFEDLLLICRANFDIKGIADSDLSRSGYVEWARLTNYSVQIPYRAIRPADVKNILVVGKAYSVTHDVLALARMQRDLMAMGGAAGFVAAAAARDNLSFDDVDVKDLQKKLVDLGVLSREDLKAIEGVEDNVLPEMSERQLRELIGRLAAGKLKLDGQVMILARPKSSIPLLKEALAGADSQGKVEVARALCFLGETTGSQILLDELDRLLAAEKLPGLTRLPTKRMAHSLPDHGFAPDPTYLINTLSRLGDRRIIPHMANIARKVKAETKTTGPGFSYVFSICYAAERLGDPACTEALTILAEKPGIHGGVRPRGTDPRKTALGLKSRREDRYAYLELCVGRALARCGSRRGYDILLDYLLDIRGFLARSAHDELVDLSDRDFGYDPKGWRSWLSSAKIGPKPYGH